MSYVVDDRPVNFEVIFYHESILKQRHSATVNPGKFPAMGIGSSLKVGFYAEKLYLCSDFDETCYTHLFYWT